MTATIVTIGDEILIGQIVDTNSGYIAKALDRIGVQTHEMLSISDDKQHILNTFSSLQDKVDFVIITGGLGPTKDDITKKTFCDYFDDHLVVNPEVLAHVTEMIEGFYKRPITQLNKDQALVPSKCEVLFNKMGTAPGMWMKKERTVYISLPGVPFEMKHIVDQVIIPKIVKEYKRPYFVHKTILTYGQGESMVAERIEHWENSLPEFIKLAYLPNPGRVRLRLTARGENEQILKNAIDENIASLTSIIGDIIVGFDEDHGELGFKGQRVHKASRAIRDRKVRPDHRGCRVRLALRALQEMRGSRVFKARLAQTEPMAPTERPAQRVQRVRHAASRPIPAARSVSRQPPKSNWPQWRSRPLPARVISSWPARPTPRTQAPRQG